MPRLPERRGLLYKAADLVILAREACLIRPSGVPHKPMEHVPWRGEVLEVSSAAKGVERETLKNIYASCSPLPSHSKGGKRTLPQGRNGPRNPFSLFPTSDKIQKLTSKSKLKSRFRPYYKGIRREKA